MKIAVYAGSFDPITNGHLHVIQKASELFDQVIVLVTINPFKNSGMFAPVERCYLVMESVKEFKNVSTKYVGGEYVARYAEKLGATHLIRGLPTVADFQFEYELYHNNKVINPEIETVFMMCDKEVQQVRSSTVRGLVGYKDWVNVVKPMVPQAVLKGLLEKEMKRKWDKLTEEDYDPAYAALKWETIHSRHKDRPYHNLFHIHQMLSDYEETKHEENSKLIQFAIWYHDLFLKTDDDCDPNKSAEKASANYAWDVIKRLRLGEDNADIVVKLIEATDHKERELSDIEKIMVCLDLKILAAETWEVYCDYVAKVKIEYSRITSEEEWNKGRIAFLESMLGRKVLFPDYQKNFVSEDKIAFFDVENVARENMSKELELRKSNAYQD